MASSRRLWEIAVVVIFGIAMVLVFWFVDRMDRNMLSRMSDRLDAIGDHIDAREAEIAVLRDENKALRNEIAALRERIANRQADGSEQ